MLKRLPEPDEQEHPDPRAEYLDTPLEVQLWETPSKKPDLEHVAGAPAWWHGDEEASQSFLTAVGYRPPEPE